MYVVRTFRTVGLAISEGVWLIRFEGSGCNCLLMQSAFLLDENGLASSQMDVDCFRLCRLALTVSVVVIVPDELSDALF